MNALLRGTNAALLACGLLVPALARAGTPEIVVDGQPPLTRQMLSDLDGFVAWLLETPLTAEQQEKLERGAIDAWRNHAREDIKGVTDSLALRAQIWQLPADQRELVRQKVLPDVLTELNKEQGHDETAKWMLAIYQASHRPLAKGRPPLTRQMSDGYAEVLFFMMSQVSGQTLEANAALKDAWAQSLARDYRQMTPAARSNLAKMPLLAAALRVAWPQLPESEREAYRAQWRGLLERMWQALPATAEASARPEPSRKKESFAEAMRKAQQQQQMFQQMSRMSMQLHYSTLNAINAAGGNPYRYVNAYGNPY